MLKKCTDEISIIIATFYLLKHVELVLLLCMLAFLYRLDIHYYISTHVPKCITRKSSLLTFNN